MVLSLWAAQRFTAAIQALNPDGRVADFSPDCKHRRKTGVPHFSRF